RARRRGGGVEARRQREDHEPPGHARTVSRAIVGRMDPEAVVREAIERRRSLFLVYRGGETRVVQPHVLYLTATGKVCLDAYQVAGASASGSLPGWRDFELALTSE